MADGLIVGMFLLVAFAQVAVTAVLGFLVTRFLATQERLVERAMARDLQDYASSVVQRLNPQPERAQTVFEQADDGVGGMTELEEEYREVTA